MNEQNQNAQAYEFLNKLTDTEQFGAIVSSNACCQIELADARLHGRFFVDSNGYGYVLRLRKWLDYAHQSIDLLSKEGRLN